MRRGRLELADFPANPFIAFVDFLLVLVLILIVTIVHQSISSSSLVERAAIANTQRELNMQVRKMQPAKTVGPDDSQQPEPDFAEYAVDGDLQRFRLRGDLSFEPNSDVLTARGETILTAFGKQLAQRQGNPYDNTTHPFKRIIVNGHADMSEGAENRLWELSLQRAQAAIAVLRRECNIHPTLLEASGRGAYESAKNSGEASPARVATANRRLEIVVVYSGSISLLYLKNKGEHTR